MKRQSPVFWVFPFLLLILSSGMGHAENYARACVSILDGEGNEAPLHEKASPGPGRKILVHLDANRACTALVVPLVENGKKLANGWRPQMVGLAEWEEKVLPESRSPWAWNQGAEPFELWIFFFKPDTPSIGTFRILTAAMQDPNLSGAVLAQQTTKLYEALGSRMTGSQNIVKGPKAGATLIGGSVRSANFPWRDYAHKVVLNDAFEGLLVVRHGR